MLRLNVHCSIIPSARQVKLGSSYGSWTIRYRRAQHLSHGTCVKALKDQRDGGTSEFPGQSWEPGLEIEVPYEQRPVSFHFVFSVAKYILSQSIKRSLLIRKA